VVAASSDWIIHLKELDLEVEVEALADFIKLRYYFIPDLASGRILIMQAIEYFNWRASKVRLQFQVININFIDLIFTRLIN